MIFAHEHLQKIKVKEVVFTSVVALVISLLIFLNTLLFSPTKVLIISLALLVVGMNLVVYIVKKSGMAIIFYFLMGIFTFTLADIGILGFRKIIVYIVAGIIFELVFLFLKLHLHNVPLDMIIGSALATASIPLSTAFLLSAGLASSFPLALINLILLALGVGVSAATLFFLVWYYFSNSSMVLKLESYLMSLAR